MARVNKNEAANSEVRVQSVQMSYADVMDKHSAFIKLVVVLTMSVVFLWISFALYAAYNFIPPYIDASRPTQKCVLGSSNQAPLP